MRWTGRLPGMIGEVVDQVGQHGRREAVQVAHPAEQGGERRGAGPPQEIEHVLELQRPRPGRRLVGHLQVRAGRWRSRPPTSGPAHSRARRAAGPRTPMRPASPPGSPLSARAACCPSATRSASGRGAGSMSRTVSPALRRPRPYSASAVQSAAPTPRRSLRRRSPTPGQDVRPLLLPDQQGLQVVAVGRRQRGLGEPVGLHAQGRDELGQRRPGRAEEIRGGVPVYRRAGHRMAHDQQAGHRGVAGRPLQPDQPMLAPDPCCPLGPAGRARASACWRSWAAISARSPASSPHQHRRLEDAPRPAGGLPLGYRRLPEGATRRPVGLVAPVAAARADLVSACVPWPPQVQK